MKKRMLKNLSIGEVSFCGKGMNPIADVILLKADITKEEYESGIMMFRDVLKEMELAEQLEDIIEKLMMYNRAFQSSLFGLLHNEEVKDKKAAIRSNLQQYVEALNTMAEGEDFSKASDVVKAWVSENPESEPDALINHLTTLHKEDSRMDKVKELEDKLKKAGEDNTKLQADLAKATALAGMTDVQKQHYNGLSPEDQEIFLKKSSDERDAIIKKASDADEVLTVGDRVIRKSVVGEDSFFVMKKQQERIEAQEAQSAKDRAEAVKKAFELKAETDYPNLPGSPEHKGQLLKAVDGLEEEPRKAVTEMLKAADEAMKKNFNENGHNQDTVSDANEKLNKLAQEKADKENLPFHKAYDAVLKTDEGMKLYNETLRH